MDEWERYTGLEHAPSSWALRRDRAHELLALDSLTGEQEKELNILTAKQAGYRVQIEKERVQGHTVYALLKPDGSIHKRAPYGAEEYIWDTVPEFCTSVDACLTLTLLPEVVWLLTHSPIPHECAAELFDGNSASQIAFAHRKPLPVDMLSAWWRIQRAC